MTVESENKVCKMHKKSRMEVRCAKRTVESENKVCGMYKNSRTDFGSALITLKSESKTCGMHKKSRMVVRYEKMTAGVRRRNAECRTTIEWSLDAQK